MKSFRINKDAAFSAESIRQAFLNPAAGKRERPDVKRVLENLENEIPVVQNMLYTENVYFRKHTPMRLNDPHDKKERYIIKPDYKYEQVIHHVAVQAIKPAVKYGMYTYALSSIPGRGLHMGKEKIERWIREDPENTRYVLKMDIRKFFPSIDHDILKALLTKKFRDEYLLNLLFQIIDMTEHGLPLGFYPSPWLANFLLQPLDHYIKEQLHVKYMTRYADDIVCFSRSKEHLHEVRRAISEYLQNRLKLTMKDNWQVFPLEYKSEEYAVTCSSLKALRILANDLSAAGIPYTEKMYRGMRRVFVDSRASPILNSLLSKHSAQYISVLVSHGRPLDYMGFVFYRDKTILRKSIMLRMTRKASQIAKQEKTNTHDAASLLSYLGWLAHTNTYGLYIARIRPFVDVKTLKKIIRKQRRRQTRNESDMENRNRLAG